MSHKGERKKPQAAKNLEFIRRGCPLMKVRGPGKTYNRFFQVNEDFLSFSYTGSKKVKWARKMVGKRGDMSKVNLTEIKDIRPGLLSDVFTNSFERLQIDPDQCFSVVVGAKHKTLDLIAPDEEVRDSWVNGLRHLRKKMSETDLATQQDLWMRELFRYADKNNDNCLTLKEIVSLLKHLNIEVDHEQAKQIFETDFDDKSHSRHPLDGITVDSDAERRADTNKVQTKKGEDVLDIDEFINFYQLLTQREEFEELFQRYNYQGKYLDPQELKDFLDAEQFMKVDMPLDDCVRLIEEYEPCPTVKAQHMLALDGFNGLMNSHLMEVFNLDHRVVYQNMELPLSDYFIDSSHNTYLTADQLMGPSAVEAYIQALKRGCRCVELDCWDGEDEPIIYHGYTLTSKIAFRDVIWAVNEYSFKDSHYPVILSIENHCSVEQQKIMAQYLKDILGDKLYTKQYPEELETLPSPESLKYKVLIKAKKSKNFERLPTVDVSDEDEAADIVDDYVQQKVLETRRLLSRDKNGKKFPSQNGDDEEVSDEDEAAEMEDETVAEDVKKKKSSHKLKLARELSDLVAICQSVSFKGFNYAVNKYNCKQMSSFSEGKAMGLCEDAPDEFVHHNQFQLSRIYPGGLRTDSSNYDPVPVWNSGCQIVALNYQTPDESMMLNKGRFRDNGGCGYVLKPSFLREEGTTFSPSGPFPEEWRKTLKLTIISGYQLPKKKKVPTATLR